MNQMATQKIVGAVLEFTNLGELFPAPSFKGRVGLDVRIEQGVLSPGAKVRLCGPGSEEIIEVVGVEMLNNPHGPDVVRIVCPAPRVLPLPTGEAVGWKIIGE